MPPGRRSKQRPRRRASSVRCRQTRSGPGLMPCSPGPAARLRDPGRLARSSGGRAVPLRRGCWHESFRAGWSRRLPGPAGCSASWQRSPPAAPRGGQLRWPVGHRRVVAAAAGATADRRDRDVGSVDETYLKVAGKWTYLYRAVDQHGQVVDVLLSVRRDLAAARRFFARAVRGHGPSRGHDRPRARLSAGPRRAGLVGAAHRRAVREQPDRSRSRTAQGPAPSDARE
jgi:DDE domain